MALEPANTTPSSGTFSPGLTTMTDPTSVGALHDRFLRREIHQRADGGPGALERPRLERLRHGEHEDDGRRLGPLAQGDGAGGGDQHQHVDVERPRADGQPGLARGQRHASHDRQSKHQP
jgi:hypothetical protein